MKLTKEQFEAAMRVISRHHSVMMKVNMPVNNFVGHLGQKRVQHSHSAWMRRSYKRPYRSGLRYPDGCQRNECI